MKAHRALEHVALRSIEATELGLSDFAVLELLLHKGPQPVNEIGRRIGLTSGAITIAVDRLAAQGLVVREAHPTDRRTRIVCLSTRGRRQATASFAIHKTAMDKAGAVLAKDERAALIRLLKKLGTSVASGET
jgi:MarR family transcriptional regulator, 2-MHQ and catechol-resistance regulon repressor